MQGFMRKKQRRLGLYSRYAHLLSGVRADYFESGGKLRTRLRARQPLVSESLIRPRSKHACPCRSWREEPAANAGTFRTKGNGDLSALLSSQVFVQNGSTPGESCGSCPSGTHVNTLSFSRPVALAPKFERDEQMKGGSTRLRARQSPIRQSLIRPYSKPCPFLA